ncbi:hypothetical protein LD39_17050, partial [Halobacillus sp. BBL2006]
KIKRNGLFHSVNFLLMTRVSGGCSWTSRFPANSSPHPATAPLSSKLSLKQSGALIKYEKLTTGSIIEFIK